MADYPEKLAEVLADFTLITDPTERADYLIAFADRFQEVPARLATRPFPEVNGVPYCESEAYVWVEEQADGALKLHFAVENPQGLSAKALAAILDETLSGLPPEEVAKVDPEIVFTIFGKDISMGKGAGLTSLVAKVQSFARQRLAARKAEDRS